MSIGNTTCFRWTSLGITSHALLWNGLECLFLAQCICLGYDVLALGNCPSHDPPRSIVFRIALWLCLALGSNALLQDYNDRLFQIAHKLYLILCRLPLVFHSLRLVFYVPAPTLV